MKEKKLVNSIVILMMILLLLGFLFFLNSKDYFLVSICLLFLVFIPYVIRVESRLRLRDILMVAVMSGVTVTARIAFFLFPQVKPMAAIVIITGASMGPEMGFATGMVSIFLSNPKW